MLKRYNINVENISQDEFAQLERELEQYAWTSSYNPQFKIFDVTFQECQDIKTLIHIPECCTIRQL